MCNDWAMDEDLLKFMSSSIVRNQFKKVLNDIRSESHVAITHYGEIAAVVVPPDWYEAALDLMARHGGTVAE